MKKRHKLTHEDLKSLGIDEQRFSKLTPKEQHNFLKLQALDQTILLRGRKERPRPDPHKKYSSSVRQILAYLWVPYRNLFIISLVLSIIQALIFLSLPLLLQSGLNKLAEMQEINAILQDFFLLIGAMVFLGIVMYIRLYLNSWVGANIIKDLRDDMFKSFQKSTYKFLDENQTGDLISRNTSDINLLRNFLSSQLALFIRMTLSVALSVAAMFWISPGVAIFAVIPIPITLIVMFFYRRKMRPLFFESRETYGEVTSIAQENITGMKVVRAFAQEERELEKFQVKNTEYFEQNQKLILFRSSFEPIVRFCANASMLMVFLFGSRLTAANSAPLQVGDFFALILLVNFSIEPLFFISRFLMDMAKINATCDRVTEILNNSLVETTELLPDIHPIRGEVEFRNVSLSYEKTDHRELKNISFKTKIGEQIAILGATGSGKSTLIRSIMQFYDLSDGNVLIDGKNINSFNLHSLRKQIGIVPQETFLFGSTILDNLKLGRIDTPLEEIIYATKLADIHEFIESLPKKYDTVLGERGVTLSGGQKQRMAIARALIIKPRILILDDSTSAVDVDTEYNIQQHFKEMFQNATIFIITQRISTVRNADRILVLSHGEMAEMGTHDELLQKPGGIYQNLYQTLKVGERA